MLIVPHLPEDGKVSIHIVNGDFPDCYIYDRSDGRDLNHRIKLKCSFGLDGEISIYNEDLLAWYAKLRWLRYPVLATPQFYEIFSEVVEKITLDDSRRFEPSDLNDFLNRCSNRIRCILTENLRDISASGGAISFEGVCECLLEANGYHIIRRNQYDRKGGDVDLECRRSRSYTSIFETGDVVLFVQVKKHEGQTDEKAVNQVLRMLKRQPEADGCVMSLGECFTDKAIRLARDNGIVLIDSDQICGLLMSLLSNRQASSG